MPHSPTLRTLMLEAALLLAAAPLLLFATRFPLWAVFLGGGLAAATVVVRRVQGAPLWPRTPANGALAFWLLVMLPVAIWAAPPSLREQYSWPRTAVVVWNVALFATLLAHGSRSRRGLMWGWAGVIAAAQAIALAAPLGMERRDKLLGLGRVYDLLPHPLVGLFQGAESGFSTNQVAGSLLFVLPLLVAIFFAGWRRRGWLWWLLALCALWMGGVMILAQSRASLLGLGAALGVSVLLTRTWGWWGLAGLTAALAAGLRFIPASWYDALGDTPAVATMGGLSTVQNFRTQVWAAAWQGSQDFFFTGMGFGTFREVARLLYPLIGIDPNYDIAHAHNFFLQVAVDFGMPGLVAMLWIYGAALVCLIRLHRVRTPIGMPLLPWLTWRVLAIGMAAALLGQSVYSMLDAVAVGSKPSFLWWGLLALIFAAANLQRQTVASTDAHSPAAEG